MTNFEYLLPTKVVFGKDSEKKLGSLIKEYSCKKVMIIYGKNSAVKSGLIAKITTALDNVGIDYVMLSGIVPNPHLSKVYEGIELAKKENVDFLLAVGGGSVIDTAKAIGYGVANEGDVWDFYIKKRTPGACLPIGAVLTIAAAGSETSNSSVITNEKTKQKKGCNSETCRMRFAVMNPELTYTLPTYQTACGCADIMMHTLERFLNDQEVPFEISDNLSIALLKTVMKYAPIAIKNPTDYEARANIMWAGSLSHNDLVGLGNGTRDWTAHPIEHELGGMFDVAHGAGLCAVWGTIVRYTYKANPERIKKLVMNLFSIDENFSTTEEIVLEGIKKMEDFFKSIGMPINISELGVNLSEEDIKALASGCTNNGKNTIGSFKKLTMTDVENIYKLAK